MINLSASIVLFNNDLEEVKNVVDDFLSATTNSILYLIDNSPIKLEKVSLLATGIERVIYIYLDENVGFGKGHNVAISKNIGETDYHLVMNADVRFKNTVLKDLFDRIDSDSDIGLIAPKILNKDGSVQFTAKQLPTPIHQFIRRFIPIKKIQDKFDFNYELKFTSFDKEMNIPSLQGSFIMFRMNALKEINKFDENFFMYYEDIDIVRRVYQKYKCIYYTDVVVEHYHAKGSFKNLRLLLFHIKSTFTYFNKWGWFIDRERAKINSELIKKYS